jgi:hypothetical protein
MGKLLVVYGTPTSVEKYFPAATGDLLCSGYRPPDPDGVADLPIFRAAITGKNHPAFNAIQYTGTSGRKNLNRINSTCQILLPGTDLSSVFSIS